MKDEKSKKDAYDKALAAYGEAMKEFHKGKMDKAKELLTAFMEKHESEREFVDRAKVYLTIIQERGKKDTFHPKTFEDYFHAGVYKMNLGDNEGALKLLEKALEMKVEEGQVYFLMSAVFCKMGQSDTSMEYLKKAIQKDKFFRILAQNEADFEPLWDDKKFKLIARLT